MSTAAAVALGATSMSDVAVLAHLAPVLGGSAERPDDGIGGVRTAKALGLRNLPSKSWQVNCGWVIAADTAADLTARTRLLGFRDHPDLRKPTRTRSATASGTSRPARPARPRAHPEDQPGLAPERRVPHRVATVNGWQ